MTRVLIIGAQGHVGRALAAGCRAEGWTVEAVEYPDLGDIRDAIVLDCGPAGVDGYVNQQWGSYFTAFERAVALVRLCEDQQAACLFLCSSPWAEWAPDQPYGASKLLIEELARSQNAHGRFPVVVDRIGMESPFDGSRAELSVRNRPGELAERVIARILSVLSDPKVIR
jgi:hypothetical protein